MVFQYNKVSCGLFCIIVLFSCTQIKTIIENEVSEKADTSITNTPKDTTSTDTPPVVGGDKFFIVEPQIVSFFYSEGAEILFTAEKPFTLTTYSVLPNGVAYGGFNAWSNGGTQYNSTREFKNEISEFVQLTDTTFRVTVYPFESVAESTVIHIMLSAVENKTELADVQIVGSNNEN